MYNYNRESDGIGWFIGIIVTLAIIAISYLVFSANNIDPWEPKPITSVEQKEFMINCATHNAVYRCEEKWEILSNAMN